jgi:hypothetical protein
MDAGFFDDDKIVDAGERAGWLLVGMLCAAKRADKDGVLSRGQIAKLKVSGWEKRLDVLIANELVVELPMSPGQYVIVNWDQWQELKAEREAKRAAWRERQDRKRKAEEAGGE